MKTRLLVINVIALKGRLAARGLGDFQVFKKNSF
jgi:hypothetical protein